MTLIVVLCAEVEEPEGGPVGQIEHRYGAHEHISAVEVNCKQLTTATDQEYKASMNELTKMMAQLHQVEAHASPRAQPPFPRWREREVSL